MILKLVKISIFDNIMNWKILNNIEQLSEIDKASEQQNILIFKHSTRCSISDAALNRVERNWKTENELVLIPYYLDLLQHRDISNAIEQRYQVIHQSPQALIIKNGKCIFSQTHSAIRLEELLQTH
jgi:bacillithiol system protein YtxJ